MFRSLKIRLVTSAVMAFFLVLGIQAYVRLAFDVPELKTLEAISDRKDVERVNQAVDQSSELIQVLVHDYATWDEVVTYVEFGGQHFIGEALLAGLITSAEVDGVRLFDNTGKVLLSCDKSAIHGGCDSNSRAVFGSDLYQWLLTYRQQVSRSVASGLYQTDQGPVIFAAAPIGREGNSNAWLVLWQAVDDVLVAKWRLQERVNVSASWSGGSAALASEAAFDIDQYPSEIQQVKRDNTGLLCWAVNDIFGYPRVFFSIQYDNSFVSQRIWSRSFLISIFLGCMLIILAFVLVERFSVNPLSRLAGEVERMRFDGGLLEVTLSDPGSIEIAKIVRQFGLLTAKVNEQYRLLQDQNRRLEKVSYQDTLTDLPNRRALDFFIDESWARMLRGEGSLCMALIDCDYFKQYNDTYGHDAGDVVLKELGRVLDTFNAQEHTIAARYGGEEFCIVMQNAKLTDAEQQLEAIRQEVEALNILHSHSSFQKVTISIGIAQVDASRQLHPKNLFRAADQALYAAKRAGRNCVFVSKIESADSAGHANE